RLSSVAGKCHRVAGVVGGGVGGGHNGGGDETGGKKGAEKRKTEGGGGGGRRCGGGRLGWRVYFFFLLFLPPRALPVRSRRRQVSWLADRYSFPAFPDLSSGLWGGANRTQLRGQPRLRTVGPYRIPSLDSHRKPTTRRL